MSVFVVLLFVMLSFSDLHHDHVVLEKRFSSMAITFLIGLYC